MMQPLIDIARSLYPLLLTPLLAFAAATLIAPRWWARVGLVDDGAPPLQGADGVWTLRSKSRATVSDALFAAVLLMAFWSLWGSLSSGWLPRNLAEGWWPAWLTAFGVPIAALATVRPWFLHSRVMTWNGETLTSRGWLDRGWSRAAADLTDLAEDKDGVTLIFADGARHRLPVILVGARWLTGILRARLAQAGVSAA